MGLCQRNRSFHGTGTVEAANKGYGNSTTTRYDVTDVETADRVLLALSENVGNRLRANQVQISVVSVGIRYWDLSYVSHQRGLQSPTNLTVELYEAACDLFRELWDGRPIRNLGSAYGQSKWGRFRQTVKSL